MINGIQHTIPQEDGSPIIKSRINVDGDKRDQFLDISGFCVVDKTFGAAPTIRLSDQDHQTDFNFREVGTGKLAQKFGDYSMNAGACRFTGIRVLAQNLPATVTVISEDKTQQATVVTFEYGGIDRIYDRLVRQVETEAIDLDSLEDDFAAMPDEKKMSEEGALLYAILQVIKHGYEGTAEADLLAIRRMYWRSKRYVEYPKYLKLLNRAIAPREFSAHGVNLKFADAQISSTFWKSLDDFLLFLKKEFGPSFLVSGSLLGLVREGGLLPHDDDLDIAILLSAKNAGEAAEQWLNIKHNLADRGMLNEPVMTTMNPPILKPKRIEGIPVDLFPAWVENGNLFVYPHTYGELKNSDVFPLKKDTITKAAIPKHPEKMLEINYGPDWRVPDASAKLPWTRWRENYKDFLNAEVFERW